MTLFDLKNRIDNLMYNSFNVLSEVVYFFKPSVKKYVINNKKHFNIHKGERCFIIGTGPSINQLTEGDIEKLKSEQIIAVNSFFKIPALKEIKPSYYVLTDDVFWKESWVFGYKEIIENYKNEKIKFITDYRSKKILDNLAVSNNSIFLHAKKFPATKIDYNISKNLHVGINVTVSSIQSAIYMGYKEIYLLGCDYTSFATLVDEHSYDDSDELYEIKDRLGMLLSFYSHVTRIHYLIRDLAKKENIEIINLTPGSLLDSYKKKHISDIL
jgi:hypothetical protein